VKEKAKLVEDVKVEVKLWIEAYEDLPDPEVQEQQNAELERLKQKLTKWKDIS